MTARVLGSLLVWVALFRRVTPGVVLTGLAVAGITIWLFPQTPSTGVRPLALLRLIGSEARDVARSTVDVAAIVLLPTREARPGIVHVDVPGATRRELAWLTSLATLTPGSFVLDATTPPGIRLHALDASDPAVLRQQVLERHLMIRAALRPRSDRTRPPKEAGA